MLSFQEMERKFGTAAAYHCLLEIEKAAHIPTENVMGVDPDSHFAMTERPGLHRGADLSPRGLFGFRRHGIFKIQNHDIAIKTARFFHSTGVGAGHEKNGTPGPDHA